MKPYMIIIALTTVILIACFAGRSIITENNKSKSKEKKLKEYEATLELVKDINKNSDFSGLELLKRSGKAEKNKQSKGISDILPDFEEDAKDGIEGIYFNYPYDSNDNRLAKISISVEPYNVYGITVGQNLNDIKSIVEERGFEKQKNSSSDDTQFVVYRKHHVSIALKFDKDTKIINTVIVSVYDKREDTVY